VRGTPARDALDGAITAITAAGCETPRLDAEVLLADVLGIERERLLIDSALTVEGSAVRAFQDAVRRRSVEREPVAYIIGHRGFRHLDLAVDHRVLVPRAETELLVEVGLTLGSQARVLDLGTGSGAVALALKDERPGLRISGSDVSEDALEVARMNGRRLGLNVHWLHADLLAGIPDEFDAILSNPPYVAEAERPGLAPEIVRHEPASSLFAGADGLATIRALITQVSERRRVDVLGLEVGAGQAQEVSELMRRAGFSSVRSERDLAGIERVLVAERGKGR
jgi:release factor glutamine methyltransferase